MNKNRKFFATVIGVIFAISIIAAMICILPVAVMNENVKRLNFTDYTEGGHGDRIHFLSTGGSDAILLESDGKFALVDCAEDSDNPRNLPALEYTGYEDKVIEYVKKIAGNEQGKATLEFIIGTHSHSDHIGGFDTLIADEDIEVKKAYIKRYNAAAINDYEVTKWDNEEVYNQFIAACENGNVEIVHETADVTERLGIFEISILNGEYDVSGKKKGENENSLGILVEAYGLRTFLAGDINNKDGDETRLGKIIGDVDVLKVGHHGHIRSTSRGFVKDLNPEIAVVTSSINKVFFGVRMNLNSVSAAIIATKENNGIIVEYRTDGLKLYRNIHSL